MIGFENEIYFPPFISPAQIVLIYHFTINTNTTFQLFKKQRITLLNK